MSDQDYLGDVKLPACIIPPLKKLSREVRPLRGRINFVEDLLQAYQNVGAVRWLTQFALTYPQDFAKILTRLVPDEVIFTPGADAGRGAERHMTEDEIRTLIAIRQRVEAIGAADASQPAQPAERTVPQIPPRLHGADQD